MNDPSALIIWMNDSKASLDAVVGVKAAALARISGLEINQTQPSLAAMNATGASSSIPTPEGFVIGVEACQIFLNQPMIQIPLQELFLGLESGDLNDQVFSVQAQKLVSSTPLPENLLELLRSAFEQLLQSEHGLSPLAVRSSATCEDLANASFAGQFDSFLSICSVEQALSAYRSVIASLFSLRVIAYCRAHNQSLPNNKMAVLVQRMVRADIGKSGVLISTDPDLIEGREFRLDSQTDKTPKLDVTDASVASIEACWGLCDALASGAIVPERYYIDNHPLVESGAANIYVSRQQQQFKSVGSEKLEPTTRAEQTSQVLSPEQILLLNHWGQQLAGVFGQPVEVEWAVDGVTYEMLLVQVRPFSFRSSAQASSTRFTKKNPKPNRELKEPIIRGVGIGSGTIEGQVSVVEHIDDGPEFREGDVLVTQSTDPAWLPLMVLASAIITEQGGRNSHAAILARELGLLCVVGCVGATQLLRGVDRVRVTCSGGAGEVTDLSTLTEADLPGTSGKDA
ncbi:MAG: PEP/pyruvate-binding domain-containing protein [Microthrixaceae bacterium]